MQRRVVDFLQAPMRLQRQHSAVPARLEGAEVAAPVNFADADGRADGDEPARFGGWTPDGVFHMEMEKTRRERGDVFRFWRGRVGNVQHIARVPNRTHVISGQSMEDRLHFLHRAGEAGMLVLDPDAHARSGGELDEAHEMFLHAAEPGCFERIWLSQKSEDAQQTGVERARDLETAFEELAMFGDRGRVIDAALEHGGGAAENLPAILACSAGD